MIWLVALLVLMTPPDWSTGSALRLHHTTMSAQSVRGAEASKLRQFAHPGHRIRLVDEKQLKGRSASIIVVGSE